MQNGFAASKQGGLASFKGQASLGVWVLDFVDDAGGDAGTFDSAPILNVVGTLAFDIDDDFAVGFRFGFEESVVDEGVLVLVTIPGAVARARFVSRLFRSRLFRLLNCAHFCLTLFFELLEKVRFCFGRNSDESYSESCDDGESGDTKKWTVCVHARFGVDRSGKDVSLRWFMCFGMLKKARALSAGFVRGRAEIFLFYRGGEITQRKVSLYSENFGRMDIPRGGRLSVCEADGKSFAPVDRRRTRMSILRAHAKISSTTRPPSGPMRR